jgi:hypothetical protein
MCQIRRIEVRTIFFETNIMSDLSYTLCEKDCAYYPYNWQSVNQINSDLFSLVRKFPSSRCEKWRFVYYYQVKLFSECSKAFALVRERQFRALVLQNG